MNSQPPVSYYAVKKLVRVSSLSDAKLLQREQEPDPTILITAFLSISPFSHSILFLIPCRVLHITVPRCHSTGFKLSKAETAATP